MKKMSKIFLCLFLLIISNAYVFAMKGKAKEVVLPATHLLDMSDEIIEYILLNIFSSKIKGNSPEEIVTAIRNLCKLRVVCREFNKSLSDKKIALFLTRLRIPNKAYYFTGQKALSFATERRYSNCVSVLIAAGADPNEKDKLLQTPLHLAAKNGDAVCLGILLNAGADIRKVDLSGKTAYQYALELKYVECMKEMLKHYLALAIKAGNVELAKKLLFIGKYFINSDEFVLLVIEVGNKEIMQVLVDFYKEKTLEIPVKSMIKLREFGINIY